MDGRLPLPTLLSRALVAFLIEFDNEFEHQTPHQTTDYGGTPRAPWLVSMVMWSRYLRHIPDEGINVKELQLRAGCDKKELQSWLTRLSAWWGYLKLETSAAATSKLVTAQSLVRPTAGGQKALAVWRPLTSTIEIRWRERFGGETTDILMARLRVVADQLDPGLPDSLPILGYGLFSSGGKATKPGPSHATNAAATLPGLLSKLLLAFAIEFENESPVSVAIAANVLPLADNGSVRIRDLPRLSGVSQEAIEMAVGFLKSRGLAVVNVEAPGKQTRVLSLTPKGRLVQTSCKAKLRKIEQTWRERFGIEQLDSLRDARVHSRRHGAALAPHGWNQALSRRLARPGSRKGLPARLPHGSASRRISRRQLVQALNLLHVPQPACGS